MSKKQSPRKSSEEWFRLITEARQSGLSDSDWCLRNGIPRSSFSQAATKLRRMSYALQKKHDTVDQLDYTSKQEVVRVDIKQELTLAKCKAVVPGIMELTPSHLDNSHTIEIRLGAAVISLSNNANPNIARIITGSLMGGNDYDC